MEARPVAEEYFKVTEVAARYKVTRQAVYKWINEGILPAVRVGTATRIRSDDLISFEKRIEPGSAKESDKEE